MGLWVQRRGTGPPVLLLHGLGASARYWDGVLAISTPYDLIAPDLLGFGRSPAPPDASYDLACHMAALEGLLADRMVIVGHSTGAIVAAGLAAAHPQHIAGVVLVSLPAFPDETTARAEIGRLSPLARLAVGNRPAARWLCAAMCRFRPLAIAMAPLLTPDLPREIASDGARHTWPSYSRTLQRVVVEHRVAADLWRIAAPVAFLHGRGDRTAPLARVAALATELRSDGRRVTLTEIDGDHHLPLRHPRAVTAAIDDLGTP